MCDVLSLLNDVVADIATIKPDCSEPERNDDPYKLMKSSEIASMMVELCGVDIVEESQKLMRAMNAEATFDVQEVLLYFRCRSSNDVQEMRAQLSELLQACGTVFMLNASVSEVATKIYNRIGLWNGAVRENPVRKFLSNYYLSLYKKSVELCPSLQTEKRISAIKDGVSLMTFKALSYIVREYRERQRAIQGDNDIPF